MINTEKLCMGCMNDSDGEEICPICGYDSKLQNHAECLPVKSEVKSRYIVGKALKFNGEGITYIGWDKSTDSIVEIKEYFPIGIAVRNPDATVSIANEKKYPFNEGLLEFLEINQKIMTQSLSSLVEVVDVFEANGTAFAVSQNIQGITLADFLSRNGGTLKWEQARALLLPLIDTVKAMNDIGIVHKGISPETIIVGRDGKLRITDYSISKLRLADSDFEPEIFEGFAAAEQYNIAEMNIDAHTDVYGFCATLFNVLIGTAIPKATLRLQDESLSIPAKFAEELPRHVLAALANGLKVKPRERTQDIETLKNELVYGEIAEVETKSAKKENEDLVSSKSVKKNVSGIKYVAISAGITAVVFILIAAILVFTVFRDDVFKPQDDSSDIDSFASAPVVEQIGSVDSDAVASVKLYNVPDFIGKTYAEILEMEEKDNFEFVVNTKEFSEQKAGTVCKQSLKKDSQVAKGTKIELVISLGPKEFKMPKITGLGVPEAQIELMKHGFLYDNIKVLEKYDEKSDPEVILEQSPAADQTVNNDSIVKIYRNTYQGDDNADQDILADILGSQN